MRIISGEYSGRRLKAVPGRKTRPTTDKVKEALFNIIGPYFDGGRVLDLYAGTGGLGIEAVSRGLSEAYLVDRQYAAIKTIEENVAVTRAADKFHIMKMSATKALSNFELQKLQFDLVLLDPPYQEQQIVKLLNQLRDKQLLKPGAQVVAETDVTVLYPEIADYTLLGQHQYGITEVSVFCYAESK
ncbi:16S rRNA (guanine(966)-N(2))-methyltransferase RsmD [Agrilactobacillus yilanensis]|uniref:16S rRNA (Guanine(966)-N(2))-methyltransferase RsmD n=1 Tax=Agrilactobacillus yilanensis TaxID=2485997 RepID=A0ABW4J6G4_9LACO|nr:16S rRNA (guanine(966)-N(2))-methyltransferase RsmD [Agrilactobacillus yilanensis]